MEKGKQQNATPKITVDGEGLTKKERRALKVPEKLKQPGTNKKESEKPSQTHNASKPKENSKPPTNQLSEKELRKLEWEKKLTAQKAQAAETTENVTKAQLRMQRREQQEAQRVAKTVKTEPKPKEITKETKQVKQTEKKIVDIRRIQIVNHLYVESLRDSAIVNYKNVHPAFVKLGVQYSTKTILGSNARCRALLTAVMYLVRDLQTPPKQEFCRYLEGILQSCVEHLQSCRPFAVSMTNALRHFKVKLHEAEKLDDRVKKDTLVSNITTYIHDEIDKAGEAISLQVNEKITNGDVILTYGCSSLIKKILVDAFNSGKQFQVIVVDGRPLLEGRHMLQRLAQVGINCSYVQINAISYVMSQATKVLLGAHGLLSNGHVMSRIGTAQVALVAQAWNKPLLVCCETYKFSERVLTDTFVYNEIGDEEMLTYADTLEETSPLVAVRNDVNLQILNLLYDVTPPHLITAVVTELAILPCTSAPVILRIKATEFA